MSGLDGELGDATTSPETNPEKISLAPGASPTGIAGNYNYALAIGTSGTTGATPAEVPGSRAPLAAAPGSNDPLAAAPGSNDPPAGLPETPFAVGLPVLAAAILAGGLFIARRSGRRTSSIT